MDNENLNNENLNNEDLEDVSGGLFEGMSQTLVFKLNSFGSAPKEEDINLIADEIEKRTNKNKDLIRLEIQKKVLDYARKNLFRKIAFRSNVKVTVIGQKVEIEIERGSIS